MDLPASITSRRAFLGGLGAAGAVGASHSFSGSLLSHSTAAGSLLESPAAKLLPHYVYGELVGASARHVIIKLPDSYSPDEITIRITSNTEICRLGCGRAWSHLKRDDRVEVGYHGVPGNDATADWLNANPVYNYGFITAFGETAAASPGDAKTGWPMVRTVINRGNYVQQEFYRDVIVSPATMVVLAHGRPVSGSTAGLSPGDFITFTGTADVPYLRSGQVWGQIIHQFQHN